MQFRVQSIKEIKIIIEHFSNYPLITQKRADFELFNKAFQLIINKKHLTIDGLLSIIALKASMNLGLSEDLSEAFPNIIPENRPQVINQIIQYVNWFIGFTLAEGNFQVSLMKSENTKIGYYILLRFTLVQHERDEQLMNYLVSYLNCGRVYKKRETSHFTVSKLEDIVKKNYPFTTR